MARNNTLPRDETALGIAVTWFRSVWAVANEAENCSVDVPRTGKPRFQKSSTAACHLGFIA